MTLQITRRRPGVLLCKDRWSLGAETESNMQRVLYGVAVVHNTVLLTAGHDPWPRPVALA